MVHHLDPFNTTSLDLYLFAVLLRPSISCHPAGLHQILMQGVPPTTSAPMTGAFPVNMGGAARIPARTIAIENENEIEIEIETGTGTGT